MIVCGHKKKAKKSRSKHAESLVPDKRAGKRPRDHVEDKLKKLLGFVPVNPRDVKRQDS